MSIVALHQRLVRDSRPSGFAWSPYSVQSALGMVADGARGATRDELAPLLVPARVLAEAQPAAADGWAIANTLWFAADLPVEPAYLAAVSAWPAGRAQEAPFRTNPEAARGTINADVAETTRGLVADLIPPGLLTTDTAAVVANALWLRAGWRHPFHEGATADAPFHAPSGPRDVPTMRGRVSGGYAEADGWHVARLAAAGGVVADVLLPAGDLASAEQGLTPDRLDALLTGPAPAELDLSLPRFRVEGAANLQAPLADLGVRRLFVPGEADLRGIADSRPPLHVSAAVHKAVLQVDERGLEGAAATAVMMETTAAIAAPPVVMRVDRPFLVLVRHLATGVVYFAARVTEP